MHPLEFLNILIPNLFGDPFSLNLASYWGERVHGGREAYLVSYFIGVSATLLCLISFLSVRRNMRLVFAGVALIGASLALGGFNPMYRWMYEHVPGFSLGRYPSKYFLMSALADRKSTRLNSSHTVISYAVFFLQKISDRETACR